MEEKTNLIEERHRFVKSTTIMTYNIVKGI